MLDSRLRTLIDPPLNAAGRAIARLGIGADEITLAGFVAGITGAVAIVAGEPIVALALILLGRLADGLDGAVARATQRTDRGAFLDIALDFVFYGSIPLAFALADQFRNALPAAVLLASFYCNGAAFLAYSTLAQKRGLTTSAQGVKGIYYLAGLAEGSETIAVFVLMCLVPAWFPVIALVFAAVCFLSAGARIVMGWRSLR
jgi:phosphatidylglycerophosphate synthase